MNKLQAVVSGAIHAVVGILFLLIIVGWFLTRGEPCEDCTLVGVVDAETIEVYSPILGNFRVWFKNHASPQVRMHRSLAAVVAEPLLHKILKAQLHSSVLDQDGVPTYFGTGVTIDSVPAPRALAREVQRLAESEARRRAEF
ncbi:MAG: hypothetical protein KBD21_03210 [Candidatus Pacebacteria bacterium]|nr:hypothetical protein [Candidatus Paceibacterota bacterium]